MDSIFRYLTETLISLGANQSLSHFVATIAMAATLFIICWLTYMLLSRRIGPLIVKISRHTPTKWDDVLLRPRFLKCVWILVCVLILSTNADSVLTAYPKALSFVDTIMQIAVLISLTALIIEFVKSLFMLFTGRENLDEVARAIDKYESEGKEYDYQPTHSLKGLQQMIVLLIICISVILLISLLLGKNPLIILSGLSAGAAVLMLVFQDSILGVVAGVQLTANKMVQVGDWISAPKYGIDGIVKEITLATVKVQNWDMTIVTMPPYSLINDAFQNWQGMFNSGGRRVKRSFTIDIDTIRFCNESEKNKFAEEPWSKKIDWTNEVPNVTLLRAYLDYLVQTLPELQNDMLHLIRELQPTAEGLPIEIYFFSSNTNFVMYEHLQADVIDYIFAKVPEFGLRVYQRPSGYSLSKIYKQ